MARVLDSKCRFLHVCLSSKIEMSFKSTWGKNYGIIQGMIKAQNGLNLVFDHINIFISGYWPDQPRHFQLHCFSVSKVHLKICSLVFLSGFFLSKSSSTFIVKTILNQKLCPSVINSFFVRGGFNWGLNFKWESLPPGTLSK